jgi:hypothetical protein
MPTNQLNVGVQNNPDGAQYIVGRAGRQGETMVSELHGRFYEQTLRGNIYSGGMTAVTSINAATFTTATTGATATPIVGLWNPTSSGVNCVVLQASLGVSITAATNTGAGGFVWMVSTGNSAITTGNAPINRRALIATGSLSKVFGGAALTGMTGTLAAIAGSALNGGSGANFSFVGTAVGQATMAPTASVENFDGSLIIPPGGVLALMCTTTPVAHSAVSGMLWEEVPV